MIEGSDGMALFEQIAHTDRQVKYPSRRILTNVNTQEEKTVLVERNEGHLYNEGDLFDSANMNDLEERIANAFEEVQTLLDNQINLIYPVGSVYMSFASTNPSELFSGTTWQQITGYVLLPSTSSGNTGGSSNITITPSGTVNVNASVQTHYTTEAEMPAHTHTIKYDEYEAHGGSSKFDSLGSAKGETWGTYTTSQPNITTGTGHTHGFTITNKTFSGTAVSKSNLQKYITVYTWRRLT